MLSTYARLFIGFSAPISQLVKEYSRESQSKNTQILPITILSANQVNQALSHPQNESLKDLIGTAYADAINADRQLIKIQENVDEQRHFIETALPALDITKRTASQGNKLNIENVQNSLNQQTTVLKTLETAQDQGRKQLNDVKVGFTELSHKHDEEWINFRDKNLQALEVAIAKVLKEEGLPALPQGEVDNLLRHDLQDVLDRFTDLGASKDLPTDQMEKLLTLNPPDYDTYFKMKAYLAIRSVDPSREHTSRSFKALSHLFEQTKDEAKQLTEKQEGAIKNLQEKVAPILRDATTNLKTINNLVKDREPLLKATGLSEQIKTLPAFEEQPKGPSGPVL